MIESIDRLVEERQGEAPALAVAVIKDGAVAHLNGYGVTGVEDAALPVTPDTLFCIGSTSKPLTGTLVMRLVDAGRLDLDAPVVDYVPWLRLAEPGLERMITLRHLLSHTSGLASAYTDYGSRDPDALELFVRNDLPGCQFVAPPGRVHFYSNAGIDLAGYIAEVVGGRYFPLLMRDQVFAPLGMTRSTYDRNVALTYPLALPHERGEDGRLRVEHRLVDNPSGSPAGFAISTVRDLARFQLMFVNGGEIDGVRFLSQQAIAEMWRPHAEIYSLGSERSYGLTFYTNQRYKGLRLVQHGGFMMSYGCRFSLIPDARGAIVVLTNWSDGLWPLSSAVIDAAFGQPDGLAYSPPAPAAADRSRWGGYTGIYLHVEEGLAEVAVRDDQLTLSRPPAAPAAMEAVEGGYVIGDVDIGFVDGDDGRADFVIIDEQPFRRLAEPLPAEQPAAEDLARYAGTYATISAFEGPHYPIAFLVEDGQLHARRDDTQVRCTWLGGQRFISPWGLYAFEERGVRLHGSILKPKVEQGA